MTIATSAACVSDATKIEPASNSDCERSRALMLMVGRSTEGRLHSFECVQCGKVSERPYRGHGVLPKLCGNACKVAAYRQRSPDKVKESRTSESFKKRSLITCTKLCDCGQTITRKATRCVECHSKESALRKQHKLARRADKKAAIAAIPCGVCARPVGYEFGSPRSFCSKACKQSTEVFLSGRRAYRSRRRARERDALAETFDPIEILSRDGWRCHICNCKTPQSLRSTHHDRAPELDHIIPLAAGGAHTRLNTACACRKCNQTKGSRPLGQLRLIA